MMLFRRSRARNAPTHHFHELIAFLGAEQRGNPQTAGLNLHRDFRPVVANASTVVSILAQIKPNQTTNQIKPNQTTNQSQHNQTQPNQIKPIPHQNKPAKTQKTQKTKRLGGGSESSRTGGVSKDRGRAQKHRGCAEEGQGGAATTQQQQRLFSPCSKYDPPVPA